MAVVLTFVLAACGSSDKNSAAGSNNETEGASTGAAQELNITAENFNFDKEEYRIKKGEPVAISLKSNQGTHGIEITNTNYKIKEGKSQTVTFNDAGEYLIKCNVPCGNGHGKMVSKLIVE
ncbi:cytochrome C oxidase subunit II [Paenibacillaceae bacterium]|nr:cytochrome C oxidase subunit II [Paenibacillaceae bacterium]